MENQREIYEALLAGETLININSVKVSLKKDGMIDSTNPIFNGVFSAPENWRIYKEPAWYESIPEGGVLCWADVCVVIIIEYDAAKYPCKYKVWDKEDSRVERWTSKATPLTKAEIQVFLNNAPEE